MGIRFKKTGERRRHFIAQWRRHRNLSQERLADQLGLSAATLSRIENGYIPYGQDFLEAVADALRCEPGDLITRNPETPEGIWSIWEQIPATERGRAIEVLKALARTGTTG